MDSLTYLNTQPLWLYGIVFILGCCIGSFLNVVIARLPALIDESLADPDELPRPNLIHPGSRCPQCKAPIRWQDNIPLFGYLRLKGMCRDCGARISIQYLLVELLTGVLFVLCAWRFGLSAALLCALILTGLLVALAVIDFETWLLPDALTLPGIVLGLACNLFEVFVPFIDAVIGAAAGYASLWIIYQVHYRITGREGMGYGDFKLLAMLGAWMGWLSLPIIMLLSSLTGIVVFVFLKLFYRFDHTKPVPFGPFLAIAGWVHLVYLTVTPS